METYENEFTNGEITVTFQPKKCIHAETCAKGLSDVFRISLIPWIDMDAANSKKIITQVRKCPSGAFSYCHNKKMVLVK